LLVVGDSASQTKPTTGGGIFNGLICSSIAAETIISAFEKGRFGHKGLRIYESRWRREIGHDIRMGFYVRKIFKQFADQHIESLLRLCNINEIHAILKKFADFDRHSCFLVEFMKQPIFWKYLFFKTSPLRPHL
jgi:digeranylgeranylglycerophospholipid reductase